MITFLLAGASGAHADVTQKDVEVAGNVLGFTATPFKGTVKLGVVYASGNPASAKDQQTLLSLLGNGLKLDDITLVPVAIATDKLESAQVDVVFATSGLGADGAKLGAFIKTKKILCITTTEADVQAGNCAVHIQSTPTVKIRASKAVEEATGVKFDPAFKMMISES